MTRDTYTGGTPASTGTDWDYREQTSHISCLVQLLEEEIILRPSPALTAHSPDVLTGIEISWKCFLLVPVINWDLSSFIALYSYNPPGNFDYPGQGI